MQLTFLGLLDRLKALFGGCVQGEQINKAVRFLVITDLHAVLNKEQLDTINKYRERVDLVITLGDIYPADLDVINPDYGVHGNHDRLGALDATHHLHGRVIEFKGIKIAGYSGGSLYKEKGIWAQWTQEESIQEAAKLTECDVLFAHDSVYTGAYDAAHCGLQGITEYVLKHKPKLLVHGHYHENIRYMLKSTELICIYRCAVIDINEKFEVFVNVLF